MLIFELAYSIIIRADSKKKYAKIKMSSIFSNISRHTVHSLKTLNHSMNLCVVVCGNTWTLAGVVVCGNTWTLAGVSSYVEILDFSWCVVVCGNTWILAGVSSYVETLGL